MGRLGAFKHLKTLPFKSYTVTIYSLKLEENFVRIFMKLPTFFQMSRARTPFGAVPISTIYGYDYPLLNDTAKDCFYKHE
jgi:hypothetical protein